MGSRFESLFVHSFEPVSFANGPGRRAVLWVQGCTLGCSGCFNPETHSLSGGNEIDIDDVFSWVRKEENKIEGLTITGGEPFQQPEAIVQLCRSIKQTTQLSVLIFTGFYLKELEAMAFFDSVRYFVDVLIAGRYDRNLLDRKSFISSSNQEIVLFSDRYTEQEIENSSGSEVIIDELGNLVFTGTDPVVGR